MDVSTLTLLGLIAPVFILIVYIMTRTLIRKEVPDSRYNQFDYITGQTHVEFQEQKEQKEDKEQNGDGNNGLSKNDFDR
ncbi:DUF3951 domain-containing protein [Paenibacillus ferrarius]|uniref:DUF3951 domain-containing protein n=1 Tax=Paenibacillus ferrarius TaxID=1469647 RepID=UPI003D27AD02